MNTKELTKLNAQRMEQWHPRHPVGEWVYFDIVHGPVVVRGYVHNGYIVNILGSHLLMVGLGHQIHPWTDKRAAKWSKAKRRA